MAVGAGGGQTGNRYELAAARVRLHWSWKSRHRTGRRQVGREVRTLIRTMWTAKPLWGAPRIHGELLKLGVTVSQATVAKYIVRHQRPPSQMWRTFLTNHVQQVVAADFFVVPTSTYRLLFVLVLLAHDRRRIVHIAVTHHPTAAWTAPQRREAFPWSNAPTYLLHDPDHAFAAVKGSVFRGRDGAPIAVAERLCRTLHWIDPARVSRSRDRLDGAWLTPRAD